MLFFTIVKSEPTVYMEEFQLQNKLIFFKETN